MKFETILSIYLIFNLLMVANFSFFQLICGILKIIERPYSSTKLLKIHYFSLSIVLLFTFCWQLVPRLSSPLVPLFNPIEKFWTPLSVGPNLEKFNTSQAGDQLSILPLSDYSFAIENGITPFLAITILIFLVIGISQIIGEIVLLLRIKRHSFLIKKYSKIAIYAHDEITVPFSYWLPGQVSVVIPTALISNSEHYWISLLHEFMHHRHGDTQWIYLLRFIKSVCFLNPFIHLWHHHLLELQEFACDEMLIRKKEIQAQKYAHCLLAVATTALTQKPTPVCAAGLTFLVKRQILNRRIKKMTTRKISYDHWFINFFIMSMVLALTTSISFAAKTIHLEKNVSLEQGLAFAKEINKSSRFPIVVNDLVLTQLNRYVGTSEGRDFMRRSLLLMENYKMMIEEKMGEYGIPKEFLAIPLIESGYQNLSAVSGKPWGAGLWMFIESTARNYGLRVDSKVDERLNVEKETDAAMRYLLANKLRFQDWPLAVLSYNMGEAKVQNAINKINSRDVWTLIRAGFEGDKDYYSKLMASIIIIENPHLVQD